MAGELGRITWEEPWWEPWRDTGQRVARRFDAGLAVHEALNGEAGAPVQFASASHQAAGQAYETQIFQTGVCPTRENLHDFFNGLCWLGFPQAKKRLNELQAGQIAQRGVGAARGPVRDAITVFDENGALMHAPEALWEALAARDWRRLFIDLRPLWPQARVIVFGHALLEKLVRPRKELTAHVWLCSCPAGPIAEVDAWLAGQVTAQRLAAKPFSPLPIMGIPGWSAENENFSFYGDSLVFRPVRRQGAS